MKASEQKHNDEKETQNEKQKERRKNSLLYKAEELEKNPTGYDVPGIDTDDDDDEKELKNLPKPVKLGPGSKNTGGKSKKNKKNKSRKTRKSKK